MRFSLVPGGRFHPIAKKMADIESLFAWIHQGYVRSGIGSEDMASRFPTQWRPHVSPFEKRTPFFPGPLFLVPVGSVSLKWYRKLIWVSKTGIIHTVPLKKKLTNFSTVCFWLLEVCSWYALSLLSGKPEVCSWSAWGLFLVWYDNMLTFFWAVLYAVTSQKSQKKLLVIHSRYIHWCAVGWVWATIKIFLLSNCSTKLESCSS